MTDEEYEQIAVMSIKRYLKSTDDDATINTLYSLAVKRLASKAKALDSIKISGITQANENGQSYTFNGEEAFTITSDIAILLPRQKNFCAW